MDLEKVKIALRKFTKEREWEKFHNPKNLAKIDEAYQPYLDREQDQLDPVSPAVLRIATYELLFSIEVPYKVAINEGVNLAKTFGPTDAYKFINGVLDRVAARARVVEIAANQG